MPQKVPRAKPSAAMIECPEASVLKEATPKAALEAHVDDMEALAICKQRHKALVDWIEE